MAAASPEGPLPTMATLFACAYLGRLRLYPAFRIGSLDDGSLIFLGGNRLAVHVAGAGRLTESRTNTTGKFRKTVGLGKTEISLFEISACKPDRWSPVPGCAGDSRKPCLQASSPYWQKGTPHSIQRAPCFCCSSSFRGVLNSWKCLILLKGSFRRGSLPFIL